MARLRERRGGRPRLPYTGEAGPLPGSEALPGVVLDAAQRQAEGHVPTQLLG